MKISQILKTAITFLFILTLSLASFAAGEVDPTFNGGAFIQPQGFVYAVARQPDGNILFGGSFTVANGLPRNSLVRVSGDNGTLDPTFNSASLSNGSIRSIVVQPDGKILVGGNFSVSGFSERAVVARLNSDGSIDNSFQLPAGFGTVFDIALQPDGRIVIAGDFVFSTPNFTRVNIARLNADGSLDTTFAPSANSLKIEDVEVQPDGKIIGAVTGGGNSSVFLKRYNQNGSDDATFSALFTSDTGINNGVIFALKVQPDGRILVGGRFSFVNNTSKVNLARLNADGSLDNTFNAPASFQIINDIEIDANGKIIVGIGQSAANRPAVARLENNGATDSSFNFTTDPALPIFAGYDVLPLADGKILLAGYKADNVFSGGTATRVNADGTNDASFSVLLGGVGNVEDIVVQPDGKVLVAGNFGAIGAAERKRFGRFNADGSADTAFNPVIPVTNSSAYSVTAIALQPDGKILVGGFFNGGLIRLNSDGSRDTTFNVTPIANFQPFDIVVQPDGKIVTGGTSGAARSVARFNADGSLDSTFSSVSADGTVRDVLVQPDGKILAGGDFNSISGTPRGKIARLNANGTLDTTFNPLGGAANGSVYEIGLQADGKIIIGGNFSSVNGTNQISIARLNTNGTLDSAFNPAINPGSAVYALKIQANGKIIIGGVFATVSGVSRFSLARLNADGTLDSNFVVGTGANGAVNALALQRNGKILVGGSFSAYNNVGKISIVRLLNDSAERTPFDFDGDGRADLAVFRPANGFWYVLPSQTNGFYGFPFGQNGDQIAPADYDGDGRTDIAVWRGSTPGAGIFAYFYITNSSDNTFRAVQFGATGDVPVPGDYDGDGKADLAVYREGSGGGTQSFFYYRPSSQPAIDYLTIGLGTTGDKPQVGDFDGDGKNDAAVFRPSSATWIVLRSSNAVTAQTAFGLSTDIPTPADFDGDGVTNIAVFRPSTGTWFTSTNPATNFGAVQFGAAGDLPVAADYDGDGRADVAVFRPSNGAWFLNRTTAGFIGVQFGANGDKPAPNAYIR